MSATDDYIDIFGSLPNIRRIRRDEFTEEFIVSTIQIDDGSKPFETAIMHPAYGTDAIPVEAYDTEPEAIEGHNKWLKIMTAPVLPDQLTDVMNGHTGQVLLEMGEKPIVHTKVKK